jgi:hypothetical protein
MNSESLPFASIENDDLRVDYLTTRGPRILGLYAKQANLQLFARTPEAHWPTPHGEYYLHGGHRLWTAPEDPFYMTPEDNVTVISERNTVTLRSNVDPAGLEKEISFHLNGNRMELLHRVTWHGSQPAEFAPWALTQMQMGGMAILPQSVTNMGLLPNRNLVLWPYSQVKDARFELQDNLVLVHGQAADYAFKIGNYNPSGWIAYALGKAVLVKTFPVSPLRGQPDMGCNCEVYVHNTFVEIETLGPLTTLQPDESMTHSESWEVHRGEYPATLETAHKISKQRLTN